MPLHPTTAALLATLTGSAAILTSKAMYQVPAFASKTFTGALFVSLGMAINWPLHCLLVRRRRRRCRKPRDGDTPLLEQQPALVATATRRPLARYRLLALPILLDLTTTILLNVAFEHASASSIQMVNSAGLVVVAILSRCLLGTKHTPRQWAGVAAAVAGLLCVGAAAALTEEEEPRGAAAPQRGYGSVLGVGFAAASTLTAGVGWVLEERYLKAGLFAPSTPVAYQRGSNRTGASRGARCLLRMLSRGRARPVSAVRSGAGGRRGHGGGAPAARSAAARAAGQRRARRARACISTASRPHLP